MLKYFLLTLFALHCNSQRVIELSGSNVVQPVQTIQSTHLPLRTVSGVSTLGSYGALSPLSYGLGYSTLGGIRGLQSVNGLSSFNIAPSPYSYLPVQRSVQQIAVQPAYQTIQPAYQTIQVQQPAVAVARPALSVASVAAIRPQVYAHQQSVHPVTAAVHQIGRTVEYRPVPFNDQPIVPQVVEVEPSDQPIHIHFKSRSSSVRLSQEHIAGEPGSVEQTSSQDEPSKVVHEVVKPVIQEVREVIQPYRQLTQEVQPVVENVHTVVSHGEGQRQQYVAEPQVLRQQIVQQVRPVQQVVQQVAQPIIREVPQVQYQTIREVPQLQYQTVREVPQLQYQVVPQYQHIRAVQPVVSSVPALAVQSPFAVRAFAQPALGLTRSVVAQPLNRGILSVQHQEVRPLSVRSEIREVRDQEISSRDNSQQKPQNSRIYAESD